MLRTKEQTFTSKDGICIHHSDGHVEHKRYVKRTWEDIEALSVVDWRTNWTLDIHYKDGKYASLAIDKGNGHDMIELLADCINKQLEVKHAEDIK
jgi:hypothetical protein